MKPSRNGAFLQRLAQSTSGNTLAIMAAAFFPLAGLIGGAVDMTRIYITKTRLQQACDAGALAGRKVMASGSWTTNGPSSSRGRAYEMFAANFQDGNYGTANLSREYTESDGTVTGVASADVPMTIMRIFGKQTSQVSVSCTAKMEIPNTDVMFVLDVTSSMNCQPGCTYATSEQSNAKIKGLRSAVKCFYEALLRVNTNENCDGANDPSATQYTGTAQIRLGFVPYAVNVNVGRLLHNDWMPDEWDQFDTRRPVFETVYSWTTGSTGSVTWGNWSAAPTLTSAAGYSNWQDISTSGGTTVAINGTTYTKRPRGANNSNLTQTQCEALNGLGSGSNRMLAYTDVGNPQAQQQSASAPVHPATTQTVNYTQNDNHTVRGYRYRYSSSGDRCRLQQSNNRTYTISRSGSATREVFWTEHERFTHFVYEKQTLDLSSLKAGGYNWNGKLSIPGYSIQTGPTVYLSGSSSATQLRIPATLEVDWDGCIEERQTYKSNNGNPGNDWGTIPSTALDANINLVPSVGNVATQWKPLIPGVFWGRYTGTNKSNKTLSSVDSADLNRNQNLDDGLSTGYYCPNEARKLAEYTTPGSLESYMTALKADSIGTYHDIGMLWGARLLSPTGIFASENAFTAKGGSIQRHMIFMTDGDAQTYSNNLDAYGSSWWARRQTTYAPSNTQLTQLVNSRLEVLCTAVKNMNITLWVISYGGGVNSANETRLENCASPGHYYSAADEDALISRFKQIASEIADLRLTQ